MTAPSDYILYYNPRDRHRNEYLLLMSTMQEDAGYETAIPNFDIICDYCEESRKCRREIQMLYLREAFDRRNCFNTCDNCKVNYGRIYEDYTAYAKAVIVLLQMV